MLMRSRAGTKLWPPDSALPFLSDVEAIARRLRGGVSFAMLGGNCDFPESL
jgi:hypothetical protein